MPSEDKPPCDDKSRSYTDREIRHLKELIERRLDSADKALLIAQTRMDERLAGMNELRDQITRERGDYLLRERFDAEHHALESRVSALELQASKWSGSIWMLGAAVSAIVILVNIALKIWVR